MFCKTQLILLSVCQTVLIWPGLHRDKVLVMNLSKRNVVGEGEVGENKRAKEEGERGRELHMGISRVSGSRKHFIKEGQDPGD